MYISKSERQETCQTSLFGQNQLKVLVICAKEAAAAPRLPGPVHTGMRRPRRRATKTRQAPAAMTAHPPAASIPLLPGPVPPPVAGAPAGVLAVAPGLTDVVVSVGAPVGVLEVVAVPVGAPEVARAAGQVGVAVVVLARVQSSQRGCVPPSDSQAIGVPFKATPDSSRSALGQNSPAL